MDQEHGAIRFLPAAFGAAMIVLIARFHPSLAERLTWGQTLGVALVMLGILLIAAQIDPSEA